MDRVFDKTDAVPVAIMQKQAVLNRVTCVANVYHTYNGGQPISFDLCYSSQVTEPEQSYTRERTLAMGDKFTPSFDFLEGKCGTVIIQNGVGLGQLMINPTPEEVALQAAAVLRVYIGDVVFILKAKRFMMFELDPDAPQPITIQASSTDCQHLCKIIGFPR